MLAYDAMKTDAGKLEEAASITSEILKEDDINTLVGTVEGYVTTENRRIENWSKLNGKTNSSGHTYNYTYSISGAYENIRSYNNLLYTLKNKLEKIEQIDGATKGLFDTAKTLFESVATGVTEIKASWNGSDFTGCSGEWMNDINEDWKKERTRIILEIEGITIAQRVHMYSLGYSGDDIADILEGCYTNEDKMLVKNIMTGAEHGYIAAFAIDPAKITGVGCLFMADYAHKLLLYDTKRLALFNNSMYESEKIWVTDPLTGELTDRTYLDGHMENMVAGKRAQMEAITQYLAAMQEHGMGAGNALYDKAMAKHKSMYASLLMWESQLYLINEDVIGEYTRNYHGKSVSGIEYDAETGSIVYTLHQINQGSKDIEGSRLESIADALFTERVRELEERLLSLNSKHFGGVVTNASLTALMVVAPEVALFTTLAMSIISGNSNVSTKLEQAVKGKAGTISVQTVEKIVNAAINSYTERNKLLAAIDKENKENLLARFGVLGEIETGDNTYLLGGGLYDPDKYRILSMYQNGRVIGDDKNEVKGLAALEGWNTDTVKEMKVAVRDATNDHFTNAQKKVVEQIIDGSFDITDVKTYNQFAETLEIMKKLRGAEEYKGAFADIKKATQYFD